MKKSNLMPTVVLTAICLVVALLLSSVNLLTKPKIEEAMAEAANEALRTVFPEGETFTEESVENKNFPSEVTKMYKENTGKGYVFEMTVTGYKPGLVIMCGIDKDGKIVGATYIASNETLSAEVGLGDRFVGKDGNTLTPDAVAGPTAKLTVNAYYRAIRAALTAFDLTLKGGEAK